MRSSLDHLVCVGSTINHIETSGIQVKQVATTHRSECTDASDLINKVVKSTQDNSNKLSSVILLIGRDTDGNEASSHLGQNNKLPQTKKKHEDYAESVC